MDSIQDGYGDNWRTETFQNTRNSGGQLNALLEFNFMNWKKIKNFHPKFFHLFIRLLMDSMTTLLTLSSPKLNLLKLVFFMIFFMIMIPLKTQIVRLCLICQDLLCFRPVNSSTCKTKQLFTFA